MHITKTEDVLTAGDIRRALEGIPDDSAICFQVVDQNDGCWIVGATISHTPDWGRYGGILSLSHPQLDVLPPMPANTLPPLIKRQLDWKEGDDDAQN